MNRFFRVIFSNSKKCLIVVSEISKGKAKSTSTNNNSKQAFIFKTIALLCMTAVTGSAYAAVDAFYGVNSNLPSTTTGVNYNGEGATGTNALAAGVSAQANRTNTIAIGAIYNNQNTQATGGYSTAVGPGTRSFGDNSTAFGNQAYTGSGANQGLAI